MPFTTDINDEDIENFFKSELVTPEDVFFRLAKEDIERLEELVGFT